MPRPTENAPPPFCVLPALFGAILQLAVRSAALHPDAARLGFIDPDWTNETLLGLAFPHGSLKRFLASIDAAIGGTPASSSNSRSTSALWAS